MIPTTVTKSGALHGLTCSAESLRGHNCSVGNSRVDRSVGSRRLSALRLGAGARRWRTDRQELRGRNPSLMPPDTVVESIGKQFDRADEALFPVLSAQSHRALTGRQLDRRHDQAAEARQPVPLVRLLARGDPAGGDDVRPLPAVAAQRRGSALRAGNRHLPRDGAAVVEQVRADVRRRDPREVGSAHAPTPTGSGAWTRST